MVKVFSNDMAQLEERGVRLEKLNKLQDRGINAYPSRAHRTATSAEAVSHFNKWSEEGREIALVGRIRRIRLHGGSVFADIEDGSGSIQLFLRKDAIGEEVFTTFQDCLDMGDFVEVTGKLFLTKKEEKTLEVGSYKILTKALLPLPEKWHGLSDVEIRYRQRYLDLVANSEVRELFTLRSRIVKTIRDFFEENGFMEVETPMLQPIPGGAIARPFITHHNALDMELFLRVAPELYLKRLIVGGYERVFEVARCFRNEGIDHSHNPEFTQVEAYMAYADYRVLMELIEQLFVRIVDNLYKKSSFEYEGRTIQVTAPFPRIGFREAIMQFGDIDIDQYPALDELAKVAATRGVAIDSTMGRGKICDELFKLYVVPNLSNPTFIIDYPIELSPLAKRKEDNPNYVERFQLVMANKEVVNAFSELNDPQDQLARFEEQQSHREAGDEEAHRVDMDFITALEHGMPPTAGLGVGIDRLTALLTNSHTLKEVILFPTLKPKND